MLKVLRFLLIVFLFVPDITNADVINTTRSRQDISLSIEGIYSYEKTINRLNTYDFWGGFGFVSEYNNLKYPAHGIELAMEIRQYFIKDRYCSFNIGLYGGYAFMRYPEFHNGKVSEYHYDFSLVPGIKLTYKMFIYSNIIIEPYVGISRANSAFPVTFGIRLGFNNLKTKK
jgi:hypothetical protein